MPSGMPSGTLFSAWSLLWVSFSLSFALPGRVEAENWSPRGPKGVSEGPRKLFQIDSTSLSVPIGGLKRAGGYPPGCLQGVYLCMYLCAFMHIHADLCRFMPVFMRIHSYSFIFMHLSCIFHVYVCIFTHIYAYLCRFRVCLI